MTRATEMAAWTAFLANSRPSADTTETTASTQKKTASAVPACAPPVVCVASASTCPLTTTPRCRGRVARVALVADRPVRVDPLLLRGRRGVDLALVVVALLQARPPSGAAPAIMPGLQRREQLVLLEDQRGPAVVGQLVLVGHRERAGRAGLDAQPAEDAAQVVDLVDAAVALARRVAAAAALGVVVVRTLDVDRVGRAGPGAQLAADALLQPVRVPVELVPPVEARRGRPLDLGVLLGLQLAEHRREGHPEAGDRREHVAELLPLVSHRTPLRLPRRALLRPSMRARFVRRPSPIAPARRRAGRHAQGLAGQRRHRMPARERVDLTGGPGVLGLGVLALREEVAAEDQERLRSR